MFLRAFGRVPGLRSPASQTNFWRLPVLSPRPLPCMYAAEPRARSHHAHASAATPNSLRMPVRLFVLAMSSALFPPPNDVTLFGSAPPSRSAFAQASLFERAARHRGVSPVSYTHLTLPTICSV